MGRVAALQNVLQGIKRMKHARFSPKTALVHKSAMGDSMMLRYNHLTRFPGMRSLASSPNVTDAWRSRFDEALERPVRETTNLVQRSIKTLTGLVQRKRDYESLFFSYRHLGARH